MTGLRPPPSLGTAMLPAGTYDGEVVLITGGATGLGRAIAIEFARLGATVVVASRSAERNDGVLADLRDAGGSGIVVGLDVREPESVTAAFDATEAQLGPVSVLVNNAAGNFQVAAERMSPNAWRAVTGIVLDGTFFCSGEFARRRMEAGLGGAVLNIGATYSWTGGPGTAHSAAAKAAVTNLTQTLAVEWAPFDIRVNCLAPGLFLHADARADMATEQRKTDPAGRIPAGRTGEAHEIGWAATYLCSPYAAYLTGHTLVLDGANWLRRGLIMPEFVPIHDQLGIVDENR